MLSPEGALYIILKSDAAVASIASSRIFPGPIPKSRPTPAIIHWRIGRVEIPLLGPQKRGELIEFQFRLICCATTYTETLNLHSAMCDALTRFGRGTVSDGLSPAQTISIDSISDISGDLANFNQVVEIWELNSGVSVNAYIPYPA